MRIRNRLLATAALTLVAAPGTLIGQVKTPPAPPPATTDKIGKGEILGLVLDSLHGGYLAVSQIVIEGARATATTDSLGKFKLEGLTPGSYQVGVFHPLLD